MLRALLEDRFQLKVHRSTEQQSMYALTVAKTGLKIKRVAVGDCWEFVPGEPVPPHDKDVGQCGIFGGDGWGSEVAVGIKFGGSPPPEGRRFVDYLFFMLRRMVIDRTGLDGRYSFVLEFTPDDTTPGVQGRGGPVPEERPTTFKSSDTIFKALERLGLKLEPIKAPAEYIVIDRAERPRPNSPVEDAVPPTRAKGAGR
jgi:uncharacterized protein (TIGR03435 family)